MTNIDFSKIIGEPSRGVGGETQGNPEFAKIIGEPSQTWTQDQPAPAIQSYEPPQSTPILTGLGNFFNDNILQPLKDMGPAQQEARKTLDTGEEPGFFDVGAGARGVMAAAAHVPFLGGLLQGVGQGTEAIMGLPARASGDPAVEAAYQAAHKTNEGGEAGLFDVPAEVRGLNAAAQTRQAQLSQLASVDDGSRPWLQRVADQAISKVYEALPYAMPVPGVKGMIRDFRTARAGGEIAARDAGLLAARRSAVDLVNGADRKSAVDLVTQKEMPLLQREGVAEPIDARPAEPPEDPQADRKLGLDDLRPKDESRLDPQQLAQTSIPDLTLRAAAEAAPGAARLTADALRPRVEPAAIPPTQFSLAAPKPVSVADLLPGRAEQAANEAATAAAAAKADKLANGIRQSVIAPQPEVPPTLESQLAASLRAVGRPDLVVGAQKGAPSATVPTVPAQRGGVVNGLDLAARDFAARSTQTPAAEAPPVTPPAPKLTAADLARQPQVQSSVPPVLPEAPVLHSLSIAPVDTAPIAPTLGLDALGKRRGALDEAALVQAAQSTSQLHATNGGATFNLVNGNLNGQPRFAVSVYPERGQVLDHAPSPAEIKSYITKNADVLAGNPDASVGTWFNKEDGKTYLDISATVANRSEALRLAKLHGQQAIYDLRTGNDIPTQGPIARFNADEGGEGRVDLGLTGRGRVSTTPTADEVAAFKNGYLRATPEQRAAAQAWYDNVGQIVAEQAHATGIPEKNIASAVAALSPAQPWLSPLRAGDNVKAIFRLIASEMKGEPTPYNIAISGAQVNKARAALRDTTGDPMQYLGGAKERGFAQAILGQDTPVIDRHMFAMGRGLQNTKEYNGPTSGPHYQRMQAAIQQAAKELAAEGHDLGPRPLTSLQAADWLVQSGRSGAEDFHPDTYFGKDAYGPQGKLPFKINLREFGRDEGGSGRLDLGLTGNKQDRPITMADLAPRSGSLADRVGPRAFGAQPGGGAPAGVRVPTIPQPKSIGFRDMLAHHKGDLAYDVATLPKTLTTIGAPEHAGGRHLASLMTSHPVAWAKGMGSGLSTTADFLKNPDAARAKMQNTIEGYKQTLRDNSGPQPPAGTAPRGLARVEIKQPHGGPGQGYEDMPATYRSPISSAIQKIPVVGRVVEGTQSGFGMAQNTARFNAAMGSLHQYEAPRSLTNPMGFGRPLTEAEKGGIADRINHFTGRGFRTEGDTAQKIAKYANLPFFSPQLRTSYLRMAGDVANAALHPRSVESLETARLAGGTLSNIGMWVVAAKLAGLNINTDPNNSNFMHIDIGPTDGARGAISGLASQFGVSAITESNGHVYLDPTHGMSGYIKAVAQTANNFATGKRGVGGSSTVLDPATNFFSNTLGPGFHQLFELARGNQIKPTDIVLPMTAGGAIEGAGGKLPTAQLASGHVYKDEQPADIQIGGTPQKTPTPSRASAPRTGTTTRTPAPAIKTPKPLKKLGG